MNKGSACDVCAHREISHVNVHAGVLIELPLRAQQGKPGGDGARSSCAHKNTAIVLEWRDSSMKWHVSVPVPTSRPVSANIQQPVAIDTRVRFGGSDLRKPNTRHRGSE